jgi:hypothetical protein
MAKESTSQVTGGGRKSYSFEKQRARRKARAKAADIRNGVYEALTVKERIAEVNARIAVKGGESKRELARLNALLAKEKAPAVKQAPLTEAQKSVKAVKRAKAAVSAIVNSATGQRI